MSVPDLEFERPADLQATAPPERRGLSRDGVRLLVTGSGPSTPHAFRELPGLLNPGDLLVVNESATVPASLPARGDAGEFLLNLSTGYGDGVWLAEPRWDAGTPGPLPIVPGAVVEAGTLPFRAIGSFPGIPRLWFFRTDGDVPAAMRLEGRPIRYGYVAGSFGLDAYQTIFSKVPGSAEMPSAGRPFTRSVLAALRRRGVRVMPILLHTGVSSLESESGAPGIPPVYPEPFEVPPATADAINATRASGHRVVAVGTTVLRAVETSWTECGVVARSGFTRRVLGPDRPIRSVDGLLTGFHDPRTSHLSLLFGFAGEPRVREAYSVAIRERLLWHEFGDTHLVWAAGPG